MQNDSVFLSDSEESISTIQDLVASETLNYSYDLLDRLTRATTKDDTASGCANLTDPLPGNYDETTTYNSSSGNLESKTGLGSYSYTDPAHIHAVTGLDGTPKYAYDANGNMTSRVVGGLTYSMIYDAENRLVEIQQGSVKVAGYGYDGDGNRVFGKNYAFSQTIPDKTIYIGDLFDVFIDADYTPTPPTNTCTNCTHKLYLPVVIDLSNKPTTGQVWRTYYYAGGQRVALRVEDRAGGASGVYWIYSDHLGSTSVTANSSGAFVSELRYSAWGETRYNYQTTPTTMRYTGQREAEAGLYFYNARWFDPLQGRFAQADTIISQLGNPVGWDRYAYSGNNPLNYTDPSGHFAIPAMLIGGGIGALVGGIAGGAIYYATNQQNFDQTEFWVAVGGGAAAGAFVGSGLGILSAATTTVAAATTATAMVSGGSSAAITEAMYMAENQNNFESAPYLINAGVSGGVAALTANPSMSFVGKAAINVAGNEITYLCNTSTDQWSLQGGVEAGAAGIGNALLYEGMSFAASEYLMMNKPIGKLGFQGDGALPSLVEVAKSERFRTGVGNALLGFASGGTSSISNWIARNLAKWE